MRQIRLKRCVQAQVVRQFGKTNVLRRFVVIPFEAFDETSTFVLFLALCGLSVSLAFGWWQVYQTKKANRGTTETKSG